MQLKSIFFLSFLLITVVSKAQGDLMIMPKRVVFDGNQRSQEVNLVNTGTDTASYAISFIQYKMKEAGGFVEITEPEEGQFFADKNLRYYPRRVRLAPNEAQTVKLQITKSSELENREYRSHLYFRAIEKQTALGSDEAQNNQNGISLNIKTVFGISIPVIIKVGTSTTKIELTNLALNRDTHKLSMDLDRSGNMSTYGNLRVMHHSEVGDPVLVGQVKGIAVYAPNPKRRFSFELQDTEQIDLSKGSLHIIYETEEGDVMGKKVFDLE
ncbi:molecular chaperone [Christiangramia marina]|uniref:fimbrial biogenesis chaperone n=1 Tax=Christiangramia marina TaxID=409436 RepID=UPI003AA8B5E7